MNKHELKSLLENIYYTLTEEAVTEELTIQQILDLSTGGVSLGTTNDQPGVITEPRPKGWVGPWPPGTPGPPKPFWFDPDQLGVPRMFPPGLGIPPSVNPYDWDAFWRRNRVV